MPACAQQVHGQRAAALGRVSQAAQQARQQQVHPRALEGRGRGVGVGVGRLGLRRLQHPLQKLLSSLLSRIPLAVIVSDIPSDCWQ